MDGILTVAACYRRRRFITTLVLGGEGAILKMLRILVGELVTV